ncbi:hypothetical protein [Lapillicoccus sp.]|uniref:hypothetical protein n=1 Tax=Lapillicoccus sp. TaxID=1909287 RepID=UPI003264FB3D
MTTTTVPDYTQIVLKAHAAAREITHAQADAVRAYAELGAPFTVPTGGNLPDPTATVDGIFDYAHQALGIQRGFAKRVTAAAV